MVGTAAYNYGIFISGYVFDNRAFQVKQYIGCGFSFCNIVVSVVHYFVIPRVFVSFVKLAESLVFDISMFCSHIDKLFVIALNAELFCHQHTDFSSAASELSAYSNYFVSHNLISP